MQVFRLIAGCLTASVFLGPLQGCGWDTPKAPTLEETVKADSRSQDAMREHYGNMLKPHSKPKAKAKARPQGVGGN